MGVIQETARGMEEERGVRMETVNGETLGGGGRRLSEGGCEGDRRIAGGYGGIKDRSVWVRLPRDTLAFNPVVTLISLSIIIGLAVWTRKRPVVALEEFTA